MPGSKIIKIPNTAQDITLEWLNSILQPHQIHVEEFILMGDAKSGRGNMSDLNRLQLRVRNERKIVEEMFVIIKTMPSDPNIRAFAKSKGYGPNEVQMYTNVIPSLQNFLSSRGVSDSNIFTTPKCYFGQEEDGNSTEDDYNFILVLEDLVASKYGFWLEGARKSFDCEHTVAAVKSLAKFHGASAAYKLAQGFESYEVEFPKFIKHSINDPALDIFIKAGFQATKQVLLNGGENNIPKGLLQRLDILERKFRLIMEKMSIKFDKNSLTVLKHSDLHFFNVAFNNEGDHLQATWFDFQNCSEGRPMLDLAFLLILNCEPEFSTVQLPQFLQLYHVNFMEIFTESKIPLNYSLETMTEEFRGFRLPAILHIISGSPIWSCGPNSNHVSRERLRRAIIYAYEIGELEIPPKI